MKILHVKGTNLYDVFSGDGWHNHTRLKVLHGGKNILHIEGRYLTKIQIIEFKKNRSFHA